MNIVHLNVEGMHCGGCVKRVTSTLRPLPGVSTVNVNLANQYVTVTGDFPHGGDALAQAVTAAGYPATLALGPPAEAKKSGGCCG